MRWLQFSVQVDGEAAEAVAEVFHRYGQGGVALEEVEVSASAEGPQALPTERPVRIVTFVPDDGRAPGVRHSLSEALGHLAMIRPLGALEERAVEDEDWASAWRDHFHVHRVGERTVVVPSWREYRAVEGDLVVRLDPGMAFGTGLHPSTRLCVRELERRVALGMAVLDLGTGSGILAIVAALRGAERVLALDIDPVAARVARENVARNGLEGMIEVREGSLPRGGLAGPRPEGWPPGGFDLVVANLTADVLAEVAQPLAWALRPGGTAIGSGIIGERFAYGVQPLLQAGLRLADAVSEGDWRAVVLTRPEEGA